jgi:Mrp family chromosome partitioning ATPase
MRLPLLNLAEKSAGYSRWLLLIDGDLRDPDLHGIFDVPLEPGLIDVLEGKVTIEEAIVPVGKTKLDLLPAGKLKTAGSDPPLRRGLRRAANRSPLLFSWGGGLSAQRRPGKGHASFKARPRVEPRSADIDPR